MCTPSTILRVNRDRLWSDLMQLKQIGSYHDEATGLEGVKRLALTDEDAEARRLVISWMTKAGMEVRIDQIGNVYATRPGTDRTLPCALMGCHSSPRKKVSASAPTWSARPSPPAASPWTMPTP